MDSAALLIPLYTRLAPLVAESIASSASAKLSSVVSAISARFGDYYSRSISKTSTIKTLINRDEPVDINSVYVTTRLKLRGRIVSDKKLISSLDSSRAIIISGTAGSGKSMLLRYLFLSTIENSQSRLPLFVELRGLNTFDSGDFVDFVIEIISKSKGSISRALFLKWLSDGRFILCLDGFDEINTEKRSLVEEQIIQLQDQNQNSIFIITSRDDDRFNGWVPFQRFQVCPMTKRDILSLIKKIRYDKEVRNRFYSKVKESLYETHNSFLSNPLLTTMMLLTFDQFSYIPEKIHIFYEQAFEALFFKHDSSKQAGFRRQHYTTLAIDQFRNCLAVFCAASYTRNMLTFSEAEAVESVRVALEYESLDADPVLFLNDLFESVCILQKDGLQITFVHRSFQEYFTAVFAIRHSTVAIPALLDNSASRFNDNVIQMIFDMNRELVERQWIRPHLAGFEDDLRNLSISDFEFCSKYYGNFVLTGYWRGRHGKEDPAIYLSHNAEKSRFITTVRFLYSSLFQDLRNIPDRNDEELIRDAFYKLLERGRSDLDIQKRSGQIFIDMRVEDMGLLSGTYFSDYIRHLRSGLINVLDHVIANIDRSDKMGINLFPRHERDERIRYLDQDRRQ